MVNVVCNLLTCGYNVEGFCSKRTLFIDQNAHCSTWWKSGQVKPNSLVSGDEPRENVVIVEGNYEEDIRSAEDVESRGGNINEFENDESDSREYEYDDREHEADSNFS